MNNYYFLHFSSSFSWKHNRETYNWKKEHTKTKTMLGPHEAFLHNSYNYN